MPKYTESQIAVLTMPKEDLNEAAGIIADWTSRLLNGRFEDDEIREDRHYDMPEDLRPHLEVLNWLRERVAELLDAIDNFGGYFPTDGEVGQATFWWSSIKAKRLKTPCPYPRQLTSSRRTR